MKGTCDNCGTETLIEAYSKLCVECLAESARRSGMLPSQRAALPVDVRQRQTGEPE